MKNYYYNLDTKQAEHFANLKTGDEMVIVVPLKKQPPNTLKSLRHYTDFDILIGCNDYLPKIELRDKIVCFGNGLPLQDKNGNDIYETYIYINETNMGLYDNDIKKLIDESIPEISYSYLLPYPLGARVGLRETWCGAREFTEHGYKTNYYYKSKQQDVDYIGDKSAWLSAQCMPCEAIRYWGTVVDIRVDRVQNISDVDWIFAGMPCISKDYFKQATDWFKHRYKKKWTWKQNLYCEIMRVRKITSND